ncbi:MDR family MFS transporter [Bifidobacterium aquikefiri]|uniref:MDR family MFS transporter n=1 Tax=Bifidobacterium aquikefiri TaxID=1653207 RepID=UPI0039E93C03
MASEIAATSRRQSGHASGGHSLMDQRQIMLVIYALMTAMFLSSLDQTVVGTAIRTIGDDLHGLNEQAWVTTAYLITSTITTPLYGKLSDIYGRRPLFIISIGLFIAGSLMSSFSTSMIMLAAFRAFQGLGAGGLMSLPLAIIGDIVAPRDRAKYQGYFLAVFGVSTVIGPLIGGIFANASNILGITGWRWVFLINVPVGLLAFGMVFAFLHLPRFGDRRRNRVDWWGAATVVVALVPLLLVAEQGREWGWGSTGSIVCYIISAIGLIAFIVIEQHMGDDAILPLRLFISKSFSMASILGALLGFGMFGAMLTIPLYLQIAEGLSPTQSGFATIPMVIGLMISSITAGLIISRTGKYQWFPPVGTAIAVIGFGFLIWAIGRPLQAMMLGMFVLGLGIGFLMQALIQASQNAVLSKDMGVATSSATFFRQIGGTMGTAVLLSVLFSVMPTNILNAMSDQTSLSTELNAALTPSVANASENRAVMKQIWNPIVSQIKKQSQQSLDAATTKVNAAASAAVQSKVSTVVKQQAAAMGITDTTVVQSMIDKQVAAATPAAQTQALKEVASKRNLSIVNGKLSIDYANASQRKAVVKEVVPKLSDSMKKNSGTSGSLTSSSSSTSDTSFLNGADGRLTQPFINGFDASARTVYWIGGSVLTFALLLTSMFRVPPLRERSALEEQAADQAAAQRLKDEAR